MRYRNCLACKTAGTLPKRGKGSAVVYDPRITAGGTPTLQGRGLAVEHVAIRAFKFGVLEPMEDFELSREEVIVACWWSGLYGARRLRKLFGTWAVIAGQHLWYSCIQIPDPPLEGHDAHP